MPVNLHAEGPLRRHFPRGLSFLLVEDDVALSSVMEHWAAWVGAKMDTASLGRTALNLAEGKIYDVVLLDLTLPDMDGEAVYTSLVGRQPALASRTIILTGGAVGLAPQTFLHRTRCPVVLKPFDLESLAQQIGRLEIAAT